MSNPYKPNTASIPNILFDYWMPRLTPGEFKVLMAIARKTYGWNKARDMISLRQIEEMTGLARKSISQMIDALVERHLIIKIKSKTEWGDDAPNLYEINIDCQEGVGIIDGGGSNLSSLPVGTSGNYQVGTSGNPQKTLYTKDTIQKKEADKPPTSTPSKRKKVQEELEEVAPRVWFTPSQKSALLEKVKGSQEKLKKIFERLSDWKISENIEGGHDYRNVLKWVMKAVEEDERKVKNGNSWHEKNKKIAENIWLKLKGRSDVSLSYNYLEFLNGVNSEATVCSFDDKHFQEKCKQALKHRNLRVDI